MNADDADDDDAQHREREEIYKTNLSFFFFQNSMKPGSGRRG